MFLRDDLARQNESPIFYGLHSHGELFDHAGKPVKELDYWIDAALVRGRDGPDKLRGFGFDMGLTAELDYELRPTITLSYAFGSGDSDPNDSVGSQLPPDGLGRK